MCTCWIKERLTQQTRELPSGEKIREIEEDGHKYLGILQYDRVKKTRNERQVQE